MWFMMRLVVSLILLTERILASETEDDISTFLNLPIQEKEQVAEQYFSCLAEQNCQIAEGNKTVCLDCFKDAFDTTNATIYGQKEIECYGSCEPAFTEANECFESNQYVGMCWVQLEFKMYGENSSSFREPDMAQGLEFYKALGYIVPAALGDSLPETEDDISTFLNLPIQEKEQVAEQYFSCLAEQNCQIAEGNKTVCLDCFKDAFDTTNATIYGQKEIECYGSCEPAFTEANECFESNQYVGMCWVQLEYKMFGENSSSFREPDMAQGLEFYKALGYIVPAALGDSLPIDLENFDGTASNRSSYLACMGDTFVKTILYPWRFISG